VSICVPTKELTKLRTDSGPKFSLIRPRVPGTCHDVRTTSSSSNEGQISAAALVLRLDWLWIESARLIIERRRYRDARAWRSTSLRA